MTDAERIVAFELGNAEKEAGPGARLIDLDGTADAIVRALADPTPAMIEAGWLAYVSRVGDGATNGERLREAFAAMLRAETREES